MSIQLLKEYIELCKKFDIEPTLVGASAFNKDPNTVKELIEKKFKSLPISSRGIRIVL